MPKTTPKNERDGTAAKKLKTEPAAKGDATLLEGTEDILRSDFEVQEIFQRVPAHVLHEILGCLDILQAIKKCRYCKVCYSLESIVISLEDRF